MPKTKTKAKKRKPYDDQSTSFRLTADLSEAIDFALDQIQAERPEQAINRSAVIRVLLSEALRSRGILKAA